MFPCKGYATRSVPISVNKIDVKPVGGAPSFGLDLVRLDTDVLKSWLHARIRWPEDQPGGWHIPKDASDDYCRHLVSEARIRKPGGGVTWMRRSRHNHYLDAEALAYAAAKMIGLERLRDDTPPPPRTEPAPTTRVPTPVQPPPPPAPAPPSAEVERPFASASYDDRTEGWFS